MSCTSTVEQRMRNKGKPSRLQSKLTRGGRNVEFHYYDRPFISERQNCLFSSSLLRHQDVKSPFLVDHYYNITTSKVPFQLITTKTLSMFRFYLWHQKRSQCRKSKISSTYGILPMVTKACGALGGQFRVNQVRLGQVRLGQAGLGWVRLGQVPLC